MERITKRLLSMAIALVLVLGLIPVSQIEVNADHVVDLNTVNNPLLNEEGVIEGNGTLTCPACGETNVDWVDLSTIDISTIALKDGQTSVHAYYNEATKGDITAARIGMPEGQYSLCLHTGVKGNSIYLQIVARKGNTVNIFGEGAIQGYVSKTEGGQKVYQGQTILSNSGGATVRIYGGEILGKGTASQPVPNSGDAISMYGGSADSPNTLLITGTAVIRNGHTDGKAGGLVYTSYTDVTIDHRASLYGGEAHGADGGNLSITNGSLTMKGGQIYGGKASGTIKSGGNVSMQYSQLIMEGGKIYDGECTNAGGNVYLYGTASLSMSGGQIYGGKASGAVQSGGIFAHAGTSVEITGGYLAGHADDAAQNIIYTRVGGTISGATIGKLQDGTALPGIVSVQTDVLTMDDVTATGVTVKATQNGAVVRLDGNTQVDNIVLTDDVTAQLQVLEGFTGAAKVDEGTDDAWGQELERIDVGTVDAQGNFTASTGTFTGKLSHSGTLGNPDFVQLGDGTMKVGSVQYRNKADDTAANIIWALDLNGLNPETHYAKLTVQSGEIALTNDLAIDVNGRDVTFTAETPVELSLIDAKNDSYDASKCGSVTIAGDQITLNRDVTGGNGKRYVTIDNDDGTVSAHRVGMKLVSVALSTANAGYYYQAQYEFDDVVAANIDSYGIAASEQNMPGKDFTTEKSGNDCVNDWTTETKALTSGDTVNGHGIVNVLKEGEDNATRGTTKVYANPYIVINANAEEAVSMVNDTANAGQEAGTALSLYDILAAIDSDWNYFASAQTQINEFAAQWADVFAGWNFQNIGK